MHLIWQPPWLSKRADLAGFDQSPIWEVFEATNGSCVDNETIVNQRDRGEVFRELKTVISRDLDVAGGS